MENKIRLLAPSIAERIAAGEVIERPASVVKELIENSLDAGATEIIVTLEDGGKSLIEILDNGHGMPPEDLELCIQRHATSKLSSLEDLEKIATLGFRGEALPSIAAVSDLSIISRSKNMPAGSTAHELSVGEITGRHLAPPRPEKVTFGQFIDSPHGTLIRARSLFSQIPARLKFLKSQGAEVSQVREWMERLALAYPAVGFKLVSNERTVLDLRPDTEHGRVRGILSDGDDYPIITATNEKDGFRDNGLNIRIHWLQGLSSPQTKRLIQVVNFRAVRDRMLQQALLAPFRQALLPGQFPAVALLIEINPAAIDVNVHPSKTEIRFLDSRKIFHTVETMVKTMIGRAGAPAYVPMSGNYSSAQNGASFSSSSSRGSESPDSNVGADVGNLGRYNSDAGVGGNTNQHNPNIGADVSNLGRYHSGAGVGGNSYATNYSGSSTSDRGFSDPASRHGATHHDNSSDARSYSASHPPSSAVVFPSFAAPRPDPAFEVWRAAEQENRHVQATFDPLLKSDHPFRFAKHVGSIFNTYIIYEKGNELLFVDQHAAHERIRYEKLRKKIVGTGSDSCVTSLSSTAQSSSNSPLASSASTSASSSAPPSPSKSPALSAQALLIPEFVKFSSDTPQLLEGRLKWLDRLGFETEMFGEDSVLFRAVPSEWGTRQLKVRLKNLIDRLLSIEAQPDSVILDEILFEALASEACHSAIRAGDVLEPEEMTDLVQQLFACEHPWNCPHGRPTVVKVPEGKLEEWFQRKI